MVGVSNSTKCDNVAHLSTTSTLPTTDEGYIACQWAAREDNERQEGHQASR